MNDYLIRKATPSDVPALFALIKELAVFVKAVREVENTEEALLRDGFGEKPLFGAYVAEHAGQVIGAAFYYWRYSTWKGKRLYLEDLVVHEPHRRHGVGQRLFEQMVRLGRENDSSGLSLQVLDWNAPALAFYKKQFMSFDEACINAHLSRQQMDAWKFAE